jgi:hypothetical protein
MTNTLFRPKSTHNLQNGHINQSRYILLVALFMQNGQTIDRQIVCFYFWVEFYPTQPGWGLHPTHGNPIKILLGSPTNLSF